jgi:hypothetical protein
MKKLFWSILALCGFALATPAYATSGYVTVSASNTVDATGTVIINATLHATPVNNSGTPISFRANGNGQASDKTVNALITYGAFSIQLADTSLTLPVNVCYQITITDNVSGKQLLGAGYSCVQPSASGNAVSGSYPWCTNLGVCNFDLYVPNLAGLVVELPGLPGPAGPQGQPGSGTIAAGTTGEVPRYTANGIALSPATGVTIDNSNNLGVIGTGTFGALAAPTATIVTENSTTANDATLNVTTAINASGVPLNIGSVNGGAFVSSQSVRGVIVGNDLYLDELATTTSFTSLSQLLQACSNAYVGSTENYMCDGRNVSPLTTAQMTFTTDVTITQSGTRMLLPCGTIHMGVYSIVVAAGVQNVEIEGCGENTTILQAQPYANPSTGACVSNHVSGFTGCAPIIIGDTTGAVNTGDIRLKHLQINTASGTPNLDVNGIYAFRTQDLTIEDVKINGDGDDTLNWIYPTPSNVGIYLNGMGNYTGGTFRDVHITSFNAGIEMTGTSSPASTGWANAGLFERLHINCPETSGAPTTGTYGVYLLAGDGNTFSGGDIEGCDKAVYLGANATGNTFDGLRTEVLNTEYYADLGSNFNSVIKGGTFYNGAITDLGSRNSFSDAFHRNINGAKGDWYASQIDATVTNHQRLGIGNGNERGMLNEIQTDYGYRWIEGYSDAVGTGYQAWSIEDLLNGVDRIFVGQYLTATPNSITNLVLNHNGVYSSSTPPTVTITPQTGCTGSGASVTATLTVIGTGQYAGQYAVTGFTGLAGGTNYNCPQANVTFSGSNQVTTATAIAEAASAGSTNDQTVINAAGTGAVVINGSNYSGTGGLVVGSGGASETTVATIDSSGNTNLAGTLKVQGASTFASFVSIKNQADAEIDYTLNAGLSATQKEALKYVDGSTSTTQWYAVKDASNNWALNSAIDNIDHFKAYQSGDTYVDSAGSGYVRVNFENNSGTGGFLVYSGGSSPTEWFGVTGSTAVRAPGLATVTGYNCLEIDASGYITNTGSPCGTGNGNGNGTVTSVGLSLPAQFNVSGSPVTGSGTLSAGWASENANVVFAGASSGSAAAPTFRALVAADIPTLNQNTTGNAATATTASAVPWSGITSVPANFPGGATGNAATATALAATPSDCSAGYAPIGVTASGAATGCAPMGTIEFGGAGSSLCTSSYCFMGIGYTGGSNYKGAFIAPRAGLIQSCSVAVGFATTGSNYYTAVLFKNGSACTSGPTVTLNGGSHIVVTDSTHTCSVAQGDQITWQMTVTGTVTGDVGYGTCQY